MKILLACLNLNGIAGSELYHYELARELKLLENDVTLFTLRDIDKQDEKRYLLNKINVRQVDRNNFDVNEEYDIVVASQPEVNAYMLHYQKINTPIISIIHSEIRSELPLIYDRIKHYISIRQPISDLLINRYLIEPKNISLIYNPIDQSRFNRNIDMKYEKFTGIFVGEVQDDIREKAVRHLVESCIENDWDLILMSESKIDFNHPNIKYVPKTWYTEYEVKKCHFTAGILMGRTTLEGWSCGVMGYMYNIDENGNILSIDTHPVKNIIKLCNSKYVAEQHLDLYKKIIEG